MEDILNALAFAALLAAQFLAVVFVSKEHRRVSHDQEGAKSGSPERSEKFGKEIWG